MSKTDQYTPRSPFMELASSSSKDLYRDRKGAFSVLFMFLFLFLLIVGLNFAFNIGARGDPVVFVEPSVTSHAKVLEELAASGVKTVGAENSSSATITVKGVGDRVVLFLDLKAESQWLQVAAAVERAGYSPQQYVVTDSSNGPIFDMLRLALGGIACLGLMSITFQGTAVPLTRMRENGTLRLFGTTPASKLTFILAQTPARLVFGLFVILTTFFTSMILGYTQAPQLFRLLVTMFIGLAMFFAIGYLLSSRSRNADTVNNISVFLPILAFFATGTGFFDYLFPKPLIEAFNFLPTSWFIHAAAADLTGDTVSAGNILMYWGLMAATTVLATAIAARLFIWDDRER